MKHHFLWVVLEQPKSMTPQSVGLESEAFAVPGFLFAPVCAKTRAGITTGAKDARNAPKRILRLPLAQSELSVPDNGE